MTEKKPRIPNMGIMDYFSGNKKKKGTTTDNITLTLNIDLNKPFDVKKNVIEAVKDTVENPNQSTSGSTGNGGSGPNFMIGSGKKKAKINTQKNKKRKYLKKTLPRKKTKRTYSRKKI